MGLFDKINKKTLEGLKDKLEASIEDVTGVKVDFDGEEQKKAEEPVTTGKKSFCTECGKELAPGAKFCTGCGTKVQTEAVASAPVMAESKESPLAERFMVILKSEFSNYEIKQNVSADALGLAVKAPNKAANGTYPVRAYDFALLNGGKVKAVIMLTEHNKDALAVYKNAKITAQHNNVAFLNFFTQMDNERAYVVSRIKAVL